MRPLMVRGAGRRPIAAWIAWAAHMRRGFAATGSALCGSRILWADRRCRRKAPVSCSH